MWKEPSAPNLCNLGCPTCDFYEKTGAKVRCQELSGAARLRVWSFYKPQMSPRQPRTTNQAWANLESSPTIIANEQAERSWSACEVASLLPRKVLQQAEKFSIVLCKCNVRCRFPGDLVALDFTCSFLWLLMTFVVNKRTFKVQTLFSATLLYLYKLQLAISSSR